MTGPAYHVWDRRIKRVAVIGSGPSGTPAARHLRDAGLDVHVYERQSAPGGIWNITPKTTLVSHPSPPPSAAAFTPVARGRQGARTYADADGVDRETFNPPNPAYWSLENNLPTQTMAFRDYPYPEGTEPYINHLHIANYVHDYAKHFGVDKVTSYDTRVELVEKVQHYWRIRLRKLEEGSDGQVQETMWDEVYDAVLVASGHYGAPKLPFIRGLDSWTTSWPEHIIHSQSYRSPHRYKGKNVLLVGIGTSAVDIALDLSPHVAKLHMIGRPLNGPEQYRALRRLQRYILPSNAEVYPEVHQFVPPQPNELAIGQGRVALSDGRVITGIDEIIFATGYQFSFPFLPQYHSDAARASEPAPLVTDGSCVQNLHRDVFYIPDPTLAFIGISTDTSAFSFFEYQALAVARVWALQAALPDISRRWEAYYAQVASMGLGRWFHTLGPEGERAYVRDTVAWLNRDAEWSGVPLISGHSEEWEREESGGLFGSLARKYGLSKAQIKELREERQETARDATARKVRDALLRRQGIPP